MVTQIVRDYWMKDLFSRVRNGTLAVQLAALLVIVLCVLVVVAPIAVQFHGRLGIAAAAISAALCLTGAGVALVAANGARTTAHALPAMLIGMIARMFIPLGIGVGLHFYSAPLADAGILVYLLVFYPVTLGVETALAMPKGTSTLSDSTPTQLRE